MPLSELDALSPSAVAHMPHEALLALSMDAVKRLTDEAAAKLSVDQMMDEDAGTKLSHDAMNVLMAMEAAELTGLAETMQQFQKLVGTTTTTTTTESTTPEEVEEEEEEAVEEEEDPIILETTAEGGVSKTLPTGLFFILSFVSLILNCA